MELTYQDGGEDLLRTMPANHLRPSRGSRPGLSLGAALVAVALAGPAAAGDDCSAPTPIDEIPSRVSIPLDGASGDAADPRPACSPGADEASVWYSLELPDDTQVRLDTSASSDHSVVSVWTGSCGALEPVTCDRDGGVNGEANHGLVDFLAEAGQRYLVMVSSPLPPSSATPRAVLDVSPGLSAPLVVDVVDADGAPVADAKVDVRNANGGFYLLRTKRTDEAGRAVLHVNDPGDHALQVLSTGRLPAAREVSIGGSTRTEVVTLPSIDPIPAAPDDVTRIVYAREQKLIHLRPDGTDVREIQLPDFESVRYPAWSPDGETIAFEGKFLGPSPRTYEIWMVEIDGTDLRQWGNLGEVTGRQLHLDWSPDGEWLLFDAGDPDAIASSILYRTSAVTPGPAEIVARPGSHGTWSPDGSLIAFDAFASLRVMRSDGTNEVVVDGSLAGNPDWSPDARHLVVASQQGILRTSLDGSDRTVLASRSDGRLGYHPLWSPHDGEVVYLEEELSSWWLTRVGRDGMGHARIHRDGLTGSVPDWSRVTPRDAPDDAHPTADLIDPDGGERLAPGEPFEIRWTARDDRAIVSQELWVIDTADQVRRRPIATDIPGGTRSWSWTPEGGSWSERLRVQLVVRDAAGQEAHDVSRYQLAISTLDQAYDRVQVTYPEGGESFDPGETVTIRWESDSFFTQSDVTVELSLDGGNTFETIDWGLPRETRSLDWTVPDEITERAVIRVLQNTWAESRPFAIGTPFPDPDVDPPPGPVTGVRVVLLAGGEAAVRWDAAEAGAVHDVVRGELTALGGGPGAVECLADDLAGEELVDPTRPGAGAGWYYLVRRGGATPADWGSDSFGLERTAPARDACP